MKLTEQNKKVLNRFSEMMIERMKQVKASDYCQGWFGQTIGAAPMNVNGRNYGGCNVSFLMLDAVLKQYEVPVYCTIRQANRLGAHVNKGSEATPVVYWDILVRTKDNKKLTYDEYKALSKPEREKCMVIPFLKSYNVFNIQQTNLDEVKPDLVKQLKEYFTADFTKDEKGMYQNKAIDEILRQQSWLCPINYEKPSNSAFYSPLGDYIVIPMKSQFKKHRKAESVFVDGQEYYHTLLHEMIHSTGIESRLNRDAKGIFGSPKYAKEELVAELSAARISAQLGFQTRVLDNAAAYLDSWIAALKEEPTFILSVMTDVEQASKMILDKMTA